MGGTTAENTGAFTPRHDRRPLGSYKNKRAGASASILVGMVEDDGKILQIL